MTPAVIPDVDRDALELAAKRTEITLRQFHGMTTLETEDQYVRCGETAGTLAALVKEIEAVFDPVVKAAHAAHKAALAAMQSQTKPLTEGRSKLNALMSDYLRRKQAAQRAADAERERLEQERRAAIVAASIADHEGDSLAAQALEETAREIEVEKEAVARPVPKVDGVSSRSVWRFRIVDAALIPRQFLAVDEKKIGGVVSALKGDHGIPGIEAYEDAVIVVRGR